jgi:hypothetical protein
MGLTQAKPSLIGGLFASQYGPHIGVRIGNRQRLGNAIAGDLLVSQLKNLALYRASPIS